MRIQLPLFGIAAASLFLVVSLASNASALYAPQGGGHQIKKYACISTEARAECDSASGFSACASVGGTCSWCATDPAALVNICVSGSQLVECPPGAGSVGCGARFNGTCIDDGMGGVFCHGGGAGSNCASIENEC